MPCHRIPVNGVSLWRSTPSRHGWIRGATQLASTAEVTGLADAVSRERGRSHHMLLACALMVASGFAGLAYQIVWTQQSTSWLGHESAAVLAVVAAFFGGLALGALTLGSRIDRST